MGIGPSPTLWPRISSSTSGRQTTICERLVSDDSLVLHALQADRDPLPGGADHVGDVGMGEGGGDHQAVGVLDAIELDEMQQTDARGAR